MREEYILLLIAVVAVSIWIPAVIAMNWKEHPKALFYLFMVELWERFSYYGMRAFLIFYLTKELVTGAFGFAETIGYGIYAAYGALVYLAPLAGGLIADRLLGYRASIIWGAILMAAGQFTLFASAGEPGTGAENNPWLLFSGLSLLALGNGFFKPNISSLVGRFYPRDDPRRDRAFTLFYMGINTGALLAPLACGAVAEIEGWRYGFLLAGIGMLLGLGIFLYTVASGVLGDKADPPAGTENARVAGLPARPFVYLGTFAVLPLVMLLVYKNDLMDIILGVIGVLMIAFMLVLSFRYEQVERQRIWVITILLLFTTVFWSFFELAGSALNVFTDKNVELSILGLSVKASMLQSVNAAFIVMFAPAFSWLWGFMSRRRVEPSAPIKFAMGLILLGAGFLVLNLGVPFGREAMIPLVFLLLLYLLHTWGELALSPVGLSLVTKLAPVQIVAFMMGFWFLSSAIAHQAGKLISNQTAVPKDAPKEQSLDLALSVFNNVGLVAIGSGVLLIILSPIIRKWMHGIR